MWFDGDLILVEDTPSYFFADPTQPVTGQENIRCYPTTRGPAIFRLREYLDRFLYTLRAMGIPNIGYDQESLRRAVCQTVQANDFVAGYVRPSIVYRHQTEKQWQHYQPTIAIAAWRSSLDYDPEMPATVKTDGAAMTITTPGDQVYKREQMIMVQNETLYVAPGVSSLNGMVRDTVITLAQGAGYTVLGAPLTPDKLETADEVLLCDTAVEVASIVAVNGHTIGDGHSGPITRQLQSLFNDTVNGRNAQGRRWLEYVDMVPHI
jgi:branched-chain amino acid aminotransferase